MIEDRVFSGERFEEVKGIVGGRIIGDICNAEGLILSKVHVERIMGIRLSWVEYFRLRTELNNIAGTYPRKVEGVCTEQSIEEFTTGRKRGCKRYRKIMEGRYSNNYIMNTPMTIAPGITLWGGYIETMGRDLVETNYGLWSRAVLDSGYKNFLFKFVHGKLYLNNQLANFVEVERKCTFCMVKEGRLMKNENVREGSPEYARRIANLSNETVTHMLWDCRWVNSIIQCTFNRICGAGNRVVDRDKYMGGY